MCNQSCIDFVKKALTRTDVENKRILEIGALDVNGSVRPILESMRPSSYLGIDIAPGKGVDEICDIYDIIKRYGPMSFDVVVSTELLEHVKDWRAGIGNIKKILSPDGIVLITTRSPGFAYHGWPYDFWRFERSDMQNIFDDFIIEKLESDESAPGIFLMARKGRRFVEKDLSGYTLLCVGTNRKTSEITGMDVFLSFRRALPDIIKSSLKKILPARVKNIIGSLTGRKKLR